MGQTRFTVNRIAIAVGHQWEFMGPTQSMTYCKASMGVMGPTQSMKCVIGQEVSLYCMHFDCSTNEPFNNSILILIQSDFPVSLWPKLR